VIHDVRIELTGLGRGKVFLDGRELRGVTDLRLDAAVREVTTLNLTLNASRVDIDAADVEVKVRREAPSYFEHNARRLLSRPRA
jgi:hypothetical protein